MTTKSAFIRARIRPDLKKSAEEILQKLGLSSTDAITIFYNQILLYNGLPFSLRLPNSDTLKAISDVLEDKNLQKANTISELFEQLEE